MNNINWDSVIEVLHFFIDKLHNGIYGNRTGALADAVLACKLRRPRKPVFIDGRNVCPTCRDNKNSLNKCCDSCGQAIDWSEDPINIDNHQYTIDDYPNAWDPGGMPTSVSNFKSHIEPSHRKNGSI